MTHAVSSRRPAEDIVDFMKVGRNNFQKKDRGNLISIRLFNLLNQFQISIF